MADVGDKLDDAPRVEASSKTAGSGDGCDEAVSPASHISSSTSRDNPELFRASKVRLASTRTSAGASGIDWSIR